MTLRSNKQHRRMLVAAVAAATAALTAGPLLTAATAHAATTQPQPRVVGTFRMKATVTTAVNVRGEHRGQILWRRWQLTSQGCTFVSCARLHLIRQRSAGRQTPLTLKQMGNGVYRGSGNFYTPLKCLGRVYRRGARVPYTVTLNITNAVAIGGVPFGTQLSAQYVNRRRIDRTPCPLGPSHDAAVYAGAITSALPVAPTASFADHPADATHPTAFASTSNSGSGGGPIVGLSWNFGDPGSSADTSTAADPTHVYGSPGTYTVTLTVADAVGMLASTQQHVTIAPG